MKIREYIMVKDEFNHPSLKEVKNFDWKGNLAYTDEIHKMLKEIFFMDKLTTEVSYVISFDHVKKAKGICKVGHGNPNETMTPLESVFTFLLLTGAYSFVLVHNHVSEMVDASFADQIISSNANTIADMFNMEFIGHMIVHPHGYTVDGGVVDITSTDNDDDDDLPYEILPNGNAVAYVFGNRIEGEVESIKRILGVC